MTKQEKAQLIREANKEFKQENITQAQKLFLQADYQHGLLQVAEYYIKKRRPLQALPLYLQCKEFKKANQIYKGIAAFLSTLLKDNTITPVKEEIQHKHLKKSN